MNVFGSILSKCEVSEVFDETLFMNVKKGCERLHNVSFCVKVLAKHQTLFFS